MDATKLQQRANYLREHRAATARELDSVNAEANKYGLDKPLPAGLRSYRRELIARLRRWTENLLATEFELSRLLQQNNNQTDAFQTDKTKKV